MSFKPYNLKIFVLAIFIILAAAIAAEDSVELREYQVKAAFLFNFTKFVDWPDEKINPTDKPFIIGVVHDDKYGSAFDPLEKEQVKGKNIKIRHFHNISIPTQPEDDNSDQFKETVQSLKECHLLFIMTSAAKQQKDIIRIVKDVPTLTVTETSDFGEDGSVMNFVKQEQKVRFEVSLTAAKQSNVKVRSGLLKLAIRVLGKQEDEQ